ncbi:MAG: carboxypeptidase-like regulatory domain-containing protein [Flavobacteriales bacterium]|nr:carboxypeptidase-like regulatory domain-containing protein [Flavobacteriales bacterium]
MKTMITLVLGLLGLGLFAQSTYGEIKGKVFDKDTKEPIPFANVHVMASGEMVGSQTNFDGKYTLKPLPAGKYDIVVSCVGYQTYTITGNEVKPDQITFADSVLLSSDLLLPPVIVEAKINIIEVETHNKVTINSKAIAISPVKQNIAMLAVGTGQVSTSADGGEIYFRGARAGDAIYLVDGVKITGSTPRIPSSGIKSLSVYSGGLPAKYGDTMGGVIVVETKSYFDMYYESLSK